MGGAGFWSKGYRDECAIMEALLRNATVHQHQRFVDDLRAGVGVVRARNNAYGPGTAALEAFALTDRNWFGLGDAPTPMWLWDCTVSPDQIHFILSESYRRLVELYMEHPANEVEIWVQSGHARFRTLLTWPSAQRRGALAWNDDRPRTDGELIRLWVHTPFNSGYARNDPAPALREQSDKLLAQWIDDVNRGRRQAHEMTRSDVRRIARGRPAGSTIWRGTPLAVRMGRGADGGEPSVRYIPNVDEPLWKHLGAPREWEPYVPDISARFVPGIEMSWPGAGEGVLFDRPRQYVNHSNDPIDISANTAGGEMTR